jgi:hypothetical protein
VTAIETVNLEASSVDGLPTGVVGRVLTMLPIGQISAILQNADGLHVVRVLERREPRNRRLDDVIETVRSDLLQRRHAQAVEEYLEPLRRSAEVWISPEVPVAGRTTAASSMIAPSPTSLPRIATAQMNSMQPSVPRPLPAAAETPPPWQQEALQAPVNSRESVDIHSLVIPQQSCNCD